MSGAFVFGDRVLVRNNDNEEWIPTIYEKYKLQGGGKGPYISQTGACWAQCLPFDGHTQHLVGTNTKYTKPKSPIIKAGDPVLVRDHNTTTWMVGIYEHYNTGAVNFPHVLTSGNAWRYCIPRNSETEHLVATELPWPPAPDIATFDTPVLVLIRDHNNTVWHKRRFKHYRADTSSYPYYTEPDDQWAQCCMYNGATKHLEYSIINPDESVEDYIARFNKGDSVLVRNKPNEPWELKTFDLIPNGYSGTDYSNLVYYTTDGYVYTHCLPTNGGRSHIFYNGVAEEITEHGFTIASGDLVLVRDEDDEDWELKSFLGKQISGTDDDMPYITDGEIWWSQCLPYNDKTKHLVNTDETYVPETINNDPQHIGYSDKQLEFTKGQEVLCRDQSNRKWKRTSFNRYDEDSAYPYYTNIDNFKYCIPYLEDTKDLEGTTTNYSANPRGLKPYDIVCYSNAGIDWRVGQFIRFSKNAYNRFIIRDQEGDESKVRYCRPYDQAVDLDIIKNRDCIYADHKTGYTFVSGQMVLVRDSVDTNWRRRIFYEITTDPLPYVTVNSNWRYCIPYDLTTRRFDETSESAEQLYPINNQLSKIIEEKLNQIEPKSNSVTSSEVLSDYEPGEIIPNFTMGDLILVRNDPDRQIWYARIFAEYNPDSHHMYVTQNMDQFRWAKPYNLLTKHQCCNPEEVIHDDTHNIDFLYQQLVLVRDHSLQPWKKMLFIKIRPNEAYPYYARCLDTCSDENYEIWGECIPYNDETKPLEGTTENWKRKAFPVPNTEHPTAAETNAMNYNMIKTVKDRSVLTRGCDILVRDNDCEIWTTATYKEPSNNPSYPYRDTDNTPWRYCLPRSEYDFLLTTTITLIDRDVDDLGQKLTKGDRMFVRDFDNAEWASVNYKAQGVRDGKVLYISNTASWKQGVKRTPQTEYLKNIGKLTSNSNAKYNVGLYCHFEYGQEVLVRNSNIQPWSVVKYKESSGHPSNPYKDTGGYVWAFCLPRTKYPFLVDTATSVLIDSTDDNGDYLPYEYEMIVRNADHEQYSLATYLCKVEINGAVYYMSKDGRAFKQALKLTSETDPLWQRVNLSKEITPGKINIDKTPEPTPIVNNYCVGQWVEGEYASGVWRQGTYAGPAQSAESGYVIVNIPGDGSITFKLEDIRPI